MLLLVRPSLCSSSTTTTTTAPGDTDPLAHSPGIVFTQPKSVIQYIVLRYYNNFFFTSYIYIILDYWGSMNIIHWGIVYTIGCRRAGVRGTRSGGGGGGRRGAE